MLGGSLVGLAAYVLIAAVFSAAISALVMMVGSRFWPERFDFALLKEDA